MAVAAEGVDAVVADAMVARRRLAVVDVRLTRGTREACAFHEEKTEVVQDNWYAHNGFSPLKTWKALNSWCNLSQHIKSAGESLPSARARSLL